MVILPEVLGFFGLSREFRNAGYFETEQAQRIALALKPAIEAGHLIALTGITGCGKWRGVPVSNTTATSFYKGTYRLPSRLVARRMGVRCSMSPVGSLPRGHRCGRRERNTIFFKASILPCMTLIFGATPLGCLGVRNLIR